MKRQKMVTNTTHLIKKKKLNYFRDVQSELKKISWTTKAELVSCTKIVLGSTLVFSIAIYIGDLFIKNGLHFVNLIFKWIT